MRRLLAALRSQIRYQIVLPYLALTVFVMLIGTAISVSLVAASWEERLTNQLVQIGRNTSEELVRRETNHLALLLQASSADRNTRTGALSMGDAYASADPIAVQKALDPYYKYAISIVSLDIDRMIAIDKNGKAIVDWLRVSDGANAPPQLVQGTDLSGVQAVRSVLNGTLVEGNDKFSNLIIFKPDLQPYFYTVVPVKRNNAVVGGLLIGIKIDRLLSMMDRNTQAAITTFYDLDGKAIGSSVLRREDELPLFEMPARALDQLRNGAANSVFNVVEQIDIRQNPYELAYSPLAIATRQVGYFSVGLSRDFQVQSVSISRNAILLFTLLLTTGAVVLGTWIARRITRPLGVLVSTAEAVSGGDLERRAQINSVNEFGVLSDAFNQMTDNLLRLYRTSRDLNQTINVADILTITTSTLQSLQPDTEAIALLNDRGLWSYHLRPGASASVHAIQTLRHSPSDPLLRELTQARTPMIVSPEEEPRLGSMGLSHATNFHSLVLTPLVLQEMLVGVLVFGNEQADAFDESIRPTVLAISNMAASALSNAVLFDRIHEEAGERRAILESIADGVIVCDQYRDIVLVNRAAENMLDLHDWHIIRRNFDSMPLERVAVNRDWLEGDQVELEHYKLGTKVVAISRAPVIGDGSQAFGEVIVMHDISAEAAVDQAKTDFIATISHELRTPLTVISGFTDLLLRGAGGAINADQRELLEAVRLRTDHMNNIVRNVIMVASIESETLRIELEPQDLWVTLENVVAPMRNAFANKGLDLTINVSDVPHILADREHLRLVLSQLVDNAYRYTAKGGVTINANQDGETIHIAISDTGQGIAPKELERLFTRFHRVEGNNSQERGSGLGLAITKQLVERQHGRVWAESVLGQGSTFNILLPIADGHNDAVIGRNERNTTA